MSTFNVPIRNSMPSPLRALKIIGEWNIKFRCLPRVSVTLLQEANFNLVQFCKQQSTGIHALTAPWMIFASGMTCHGNIIWMFKLYWEISSSFLGLIYHRTFSKVQASAGAFLKCQLLHFLPLCLAFEIISGAVWVIVCGLVGLDCGIGRVFFQVRGDCALIRMAYWSWCSDW